MTDCVRSRYDFKFGDCSVDIAKNEKALFEQYYWYMFDRVVEMFEYENLPNTIPKKDYLFILFNNGDATLTKVNNNYYAFNGQLGGILNEYYLPTESIVANPYLNFNKILKIDKDCVVVFNDSMHMGLRSLFSRYASLISKIDVSLYWCTVNSRTQKLYEAGNDNDKKALEEIFANIENGSKMEVFANQNIMQKLQNTDFSNQAVTTSSIKSLIELKQYYMANWYMELAIPMNGNMKRESLNSDEVDANDYSSLPLIQNMLNSQRIAFDKFNKLYGTNIKVKLSKIWQSIYDYILEDDTKTEDSDKTSKEETMNEETTKEAKENETKGND